MTRPRRSIQPGSGRHRWLSRSPSHVAATAGPRWPEWPPIAFEHPDGVPRLKLHPVHYPRGRVQRRDEEYGAAGCHAWLTHDRAPATSGLSKPERNKRERPREQEVGERPRHPHQAVGHLNRVTVDRLPQPRSRRPWPRRESSHPGSRKTGTGAVQQTRPLTEPLSLIRLSRDRVRWRPLPRTAAPL